MKNVIFCCLVCVILAACGGGGSAPTLGNSGTNVTTNTNTPLATNTGTPTTNTTSGWVQIGSGLADAQPNYRNPSMALGNDGNPVVVYEGGVAYVGGKWDIYVKRWNGQSWVQLGGALHIDATKTIGDPVIAVDPVSGNPVVAWREGTINVDLIYVKTWNGSSWTSLGGPLNMDASKDAGAPTIAIGQDGKAVVAWSEQAVDIFNRPVTRVYVKKWNGSGWSSIGGALGLNSIVKDPNVAIDPTDGNPVIAYSKGDLVGGSGTYAGSVIVAKWNGSTWSGLGPEMNDFFTAEHPRLAIGPDGKPIVVWQQILSYSNTVSVRKWDGSVWTALPTLYPFGDHYNPSVAVSSAGNPVVAYRDVSHTVYVKEWAGTSWNQIGSEVVNGLNDPEFPALAIGADGKPIVAWQESKYYYPVQIYVKKWQ